MKLDAMTIGAVGFAAFAAWYVLKKPAATSATANSYGASSGGQLAMDFAAAQRQVVGDATLQNNRTLYSLFGYDKSSLGYSV